MVITFDFDCSVWSYLDFAHLGLAQVGFIYIGIQIFLKVWPWNKLLHNHRLAVLQTCSQETHDIRVMAMAEPCEDEILQALIPKGKKAGILRRG